MVWVTQNCLPLIISSVTPEADESFFDQAGADTKSGCTARVTQKSRARSENFLACRLDFNEYLPF
jgi:hypothetical protein